MRWGNPRLPERRAGPCMSDQDLGRWGSPQKPGGWGVLETPHPRTAYACLEFAFSELARRGWDFRAPPFCGFRENTGVPCPVGGGGRGGGMISSILSLRSKGKCTQQLIPSTCGQSGPSFARTRAGRGRSGRPGAVGRRLDPRARAPGAAQADPGGAGEARATRYFSQGPGLSSNPGSTAEGTQKKKEDAVEKRGAGPG